MRTFITITLVIISSIVLIASAPQLEQSHTSLTVIISDLHFGVGRLSTSPGAEWHPYEDFRWKDEFGLFLAEINARGNGNATLILNGDTFELWQSLSETDCRHENNLGLDFGCSESEALDRIRRVIHEHQLELNALREFASVGANRIVLIPGNHDAALLFPSVGSAAIGAIVKNNAELLQKVTIEKTGYWRSPDKLILAEHGHQIGEDVNSWKENWPSPFVTGSDGISYLIRPWGEQFVQDYYNLFEYRYPIIDNIAEETEAVKYAMRAGGLIDSTKDVVGFIKFFLFDTSWNQFSSVLERQDSTTPTESEWDLATIRKIGSSFLVDSLPVNHPFYNSAVEAFQKGRLDYAFAKLTEHEIEEICTARKEMRAVQEYQGTESENRVKVCPTLNPTLSSSFQSLMRRDEAVQAEHFRMACKALQDCVSSPFQVFVYSHTHRAKYPAANESMQEDWRPMVVNTGAWQRVTNRERLERERKRRGIKDEKEMLRLKPEDLPPCYSFVEIPSYAPGEKPTAQLHFWSLGERNWAITDSCT